MTTTPLGDAKNRLSELVERAATTHERFEITVHGHPKAVLVSAEDWESLMETLDILSDPETLASLAASEQDIAEGRVHTMEEVEADLRARRHDS